MKPRRSLRAWLEGRAEDPHDVLAGLLRAAEEDPEFRRRVEFVLRLPALPRESLIATAVREMELRGEFAAIRKGFALLATDRGASTALRYLESR